MRGRAILNTPVFHSAQRAECEACALVLDAAIIERRIDRDTTGYVILVDAADADRAHQEIDGYRRDEADSLPTRRDDERIQTAGGWLGVYGYIAVIVLVDILRDRRTFGENWSETGSAEAESIMQGQWWRTITALTLHADMPHLCANAIVGALFGLFAGQRLGSGLAWLTILLAGAAGNALNAWFLPDHHASIGASTAVFAALGMVASMAWIDRRRSLRPWRKRWAPLVGGVVLLGYFGAGGPRTDVSAHLFGFICGLIAGLSITRLVKARALSPPRQSAFALAALLILVVAWGVALTA